MPADPAQRFLIRTYQPGDERAILDLFARSFHEPMSAEAWRWKYLHSPHGSRRITVTFDQSRLVAHYAGYPVRFLLDGRVLQAHHVGDTMTDPAVRHIGRGPSSVLAQTAQHFYETYCDDRVAFNFGFNVANIQRFSIRFLRGERVEPVHYRMADLASSPPAELSRWARWARGYQFVITHSVGDEWDALFGRLAPHYRFLLQRDSAYLRWRYLERPGRPYALLAFRQWRRLVGWMVFRIRGERLIIGDLLLDPARVESLSLALRQVAQTHRPALIDGWFSPRPEWLQGALAAAGLRPAREPQDLGLMCVPFQLPAAAEAMRTSLYYTMGDGDLF